jgi:hypothetical protein
MREAFTPLERAALDGLAWELSAIAPDLAGQITESLPGQRRVQGPVLVTETIVDRHRPNPPETTTGRLGTIHVQIDHLEHPIAFQAELVNGRLIALHGDAYGQDLTRVDLTGEVVDQVFRLRPDGHPVPFDLRDRADAIREASPLRRLQANPDPPPPEPRYAPPPPDPTFDVLLGKTAGTRPNPPSDGAAQRASMSGSAGEFAMAALFGKKIEEAPAADPADPPSDEVTSVRIGIVALAVVIGLFLSLVMGFHPIFAAVPVFWVARALLRRPVVERIARALSARRV